MIFDHLDWFALIRMEYVSYHDLRSVAEFSDKTMLVVKAPPDTIMECDRDTTEEVGH